MLERYSAEISNWLSKLTWIVETSSLKLAQYSVVVSNSITGKAHIYTVGCGLKFTTWRLDGIALYHINLRSLIPLDRHPVVKQDLEVRSITTMSRREEMFPSGLQRYTISLVLCWLTYFKETGSRIQCRPTSSWIFDFCCDWQVDQSILPFNF